MVKIASFQIDFSSSNDSKYSLGSRALLFYREVRHFVSASNRIPTQQVLKNSSFAGGRLELPPYSKKIKN